MVGTSLNEYEILAPLGAGGMGDVYRARDTKLDRDVALKVLPPHLATDPEALARFEREAKAIAALSHPNILAIHDFGSDAATSYVVTELLEGQTLRERLEDSSLLPPKDVVKVAEGIARGLAGAHDKNIVHRDLKPENVFITREGHVKILDFGLAKQSTGQGALGSSPDTDVTSAGSALSDLRTGLHTGPGIVMGTVGYMAPEQARGEAADPRSDIFALGCVVFEMATGERPFERETAAETITAILREDAPEMASGGVAVSPALEQVVRHCLEKRPEERFQSARDLAFALRALSGTQTGSGPTVAASADPPRARGPRPWLAAAAALLLLGAGFLAGRETRQPITSTSTSTTIVSFEQVTDAAGVETTPTLSPDGRSIVYAAESGASSDIYLLRVGARRPVSLTANSPARDTTPVFSPDGERIAFRSDRDGGGIFLMTAEGESVTRVSDVGFYPSWSPDGGEIVVASATFTYPTDLGASVGGLVAIDVATGERRQVSDGPGDMQPAWSPNGLRVAYWALRGESGQRDLWTVAADGSERGSLGRSVTDDPALDWNPVWSPGGDYLYFSSNRGGTMNLWRVAIDEATGEVLDDPEPLTTPSLWSGGFSFSADGTQLAYASLDWRSTLYRAAFDAASEQIVGVPEPLRRSTRPIRDHELSPDGEWIAFTETGAQEDLFVARTDGTEYRRLTDDAARDRSPVWSPAGDRLAFYSDRSGEYRLWTIRPDGSEATLLSTIKASMPTWSPDGDRIAAGAIGSPEWTIFDATTVQEPQPGVGHPGPGAGREFWPLSWSASGRLAGLRISNDGSGQGLSIFDFANGGYTDVVEWTSAAFLMAAWIDDERLLLRSEQGISILGLDGSRRPIIDVGGYDVGRSMGLSRDRQWITYTETATQGDIWLARLRQW